MGIPSKILRLGRRILSKLRNYITAVIVCFEYSLNHKIEVADIVSTWNKILKITEAHPQKPVKVSYGGRKYTLYGWMGGETISSAI